MNSPVNPMLPTVVIKPKIYKERWLILFVLAWLNFTNGLLWISYASISDVVSKFYNVSLDEVNYLSLVYPVGTIVLGLPVIWGIDIVGLRITCITCGWFNLGSAVLRLISSDIYINNKYLYIISMLGQVLGAIAQPLAMFSPAKLASLWFASHQRALATTIGAMGNPLGILIGTLLPPYCISIGLFNISISIMIIALISALLPTLAIYHSRPIIAPIINVDHHDTISQLNNTNNQLQEYSFIHQLRICWTSLPFIILSMAFGVGLGLFTALSTLFQQILCPHGYSDIFAGICGGLLIGCGLIGSLISGLIADKTKKFTEIVQFCLTNATFGIIAFSVLSNYSNLEVCIALSVVYIGTFGVALYSVALELAAEISFPVSENVSTGILVVTGQIFSVLFIVLSQFLWKPFNNSSVISCNNNNTNAGQQKDYWIFNAFLSGVAVLASSVMLLAFSSQYRRQMMESTLLSSQNKFESDIEVSLNQ